MVELCFHQSCPRPARWTGVWIRQAIPGTAGLYERHPICALHAEPTAHDAPLRLEELPARVQEAKEWRVAVRKADAVQNIAMPGIAWPAPMKKQHKRGRA